MTIMDWMLPISVEVSGKSILWSFTTTVAVSGVVYAVEWIKKL